MPTSPCILFYVQHLLGVGHLARTSRIAAATAAQGGRVVMVTGGRAVPGFPGEGIETVTLPPLQAAGGSFAGLADENGELVTQDYLDRRRDLLLATLASVAPDVVVTEAFPFGRRQMRFELLPLLHAISLQRPRPLLCASIRDILQVKKRPERAAETVELIQQHYDHVLVHGDPEFVNLAESFPLVDSIASRVTYTGLVAPPRVVPSSEGFDVVVSAGGGAFGEGVAMAALAAARHLPSLRFCIIAGPNLPEQVRDKLKNGAAHLPDGQVTVETFRKDFASLLAASRLSVSQAGYNTVCDILRAGCRSVLIPYADQGETEQSVRAGRLAAARRALVLPESDLDGLALATAIRQALDGAEPASLEPDLNGAQRTADLLCSFARGVA
ncbi:glycosyltransferase family protein [Halodurantibacterium flavum]|uniref:Glycosyltransferase family protein n=1 Tax=Halodurantibacterium flavum TaxID=1382802 RepID=A0ABW4S0V9_9RHOB